MTEKSLKSIVLDYIHAKTGWGNPLRPYCEFEDLFILETIEKNGGVTEVVVRYVFDEDGFSQYDRGHVIEGRITISSSGEIIKAELEETHTGPASVYDSYFPGEDSD
jgi:hypothetical protein